MNASPSSHARRLGLVALAAALGVAAVVADGVRHGSPPGPAAAVWPQQAAPGGAAALFLEGQGFIPMPADTPAAHASALLPMPPDSPARLLAFWFAGTRESAPDVRIAASWVDGAGQWRPARFVVDRKTLAAEAGHGIRRLGNPVAWRDAQGRVHLFVVATGLGGWGAGRIAHLRADAAASPDALRFSLVRVLPLSWMWNTSHLVRTAAVPLQDGGMLLPLYFELGIKYPMAARFSPDGDFLGLQRLSSRAGLLQPTIVVRDPQRWLALMRDHTGGQRIAAADTSDGGGQWQDLPSLDLANPDASIAGLGLGPGLSVLVHNPRGTGRESLVLSRSADGRTWQRVAELPRDDAAAQNPGSPEYSYPALAWSDGRLWVSYTSNRRRIAWASFRPGPR